MNAVWSGASELFVALQLERKTSHNKHSCYYVLLYVLCSMLECLIYKAVNTWKLCNLLCVFLLSNADGSCHDYSCQ